MADTDGFASLASTRGVTVVWAGDLDVESSPLLAACLSVLGERDVGTITLDASGITFIDCSGLGMLLGAQARLDGGLRLLAPSPAVLRLLSVLGLQEHLTCVAGQAATPPSQPGTTLAQATGLVMGSYRCSAEAASALLAGTARAHHVEVGVLAGLLVTLGTEGSTLPSDVSDAVVRVMEPAGADDRVVTLPTDGSGRGPAGVRTAGRDG